MGHLEFGKLAHIRRIVYFSLSPHELNCMSGIISHGVPNMVRRVREQFFRVVPPFVISYLIYDWATKENYKFNRKNPKDFENDV